MKALVITGDKQFRPGHPRFDLQARAVERLEALYWGRGAFWPSIPSGAFDVVTAQDPFWRGLFALYAAKKLQARCNVQVHTDLSALSFLRRFLARWVLRRADSVRVVSEKLKAQVAALGVRVPLRVLPIFVDTAALAGLAHTPGAQKTVLWIGRFEPEKDPLQAIVLLREVRKGGTDARLVMLGKGSLEGALRRAARELPVEFPGWQPPAPYLAAADAVLSTSLHESYGASIIEALSAGVPVVAPDVGVAREAGATVAAREHLAEALQEALRSPRRGVLQLQLMTREQWIAAFKQSLE